jgi:Flp pilus assembly protein TadD
LLGSACISLDEVDKGEEILRLAVQYAGDGGAAGEIYLRLGSAMMKDGRSGEAIAPLRRAINLGAEGQVVWPVLAQALLERKRHLAAFGALAEARRAGVDEEKLKAAENSIRKELGDALVKWEQHMEAQEAGKN